MVFVSFGIVVFFVFGVVFRVVHRLFSLMSRKRNPVCLDRHLPVEISAMNPGADGDEPAQDFPARGGQVLLRPQLITAISGASGRAVPAMWTCGCRDVRLSGCGAAPVSCSGSNARCRADVTEQQHGDVPPRSQNNRVVILTRWRSQSAGGGCRTALAHRRCHTSPADAAPHRCRPLAWRRTSWSGP